MQLNKIQLRMDKKLQITSLFSFSCVHFYWSILLYILIFLPSSRNIFLCYYYTLRLFFSFGHTSWLMGYQFSDQGLNSRLSAVKLWSPKHWTTREFAFYNFILNGTQYFFQDKFLEMESLGHNLRLLKYIAEMPFTNTTL